jgi:hypothetical protein
VVDSREAERTLARESTEGPQIDWQLILGNRLKRAVQADPRTRQISPLLCYAGAVVDVEDLLRGLLGELNPDRADLEDEFQELLEIWELPRDLLDGVYFEGGGLRFSLDLLELPGDLAFLTTLSDPLDFDVPMRAIAMLVEPVTATDMSALLPHGYQPRRDLLATS